ncbi:MAG: YihY/virulence factor BrkB family protein [Bacteroidales bacterium]|nr:YihY/virulence factor BrkB family protein [Bacteroidales bacterium]
MAKIIKQALKFLDKDLWRMPIEELPPRRNFLFKQLRILVVAVKGFFEDKVQLRASALTFYTMLSVVPIVAMVFGIAKGFDYDTKVKQQLMEKFSEQQEVLDWILKFADSMLDNMKGSLVAGIGMVLLLWSVMKVLGNIENSFNDIWQIKKSRTFIRKLTDYFSIIFIGTILLILSSSATVFINSQIDKMEQGSSILGYVGPFLRFLMGLTPYVLVWFLFTFIYMVIPNTRVTFKSAFIAGIIAGTLFQLLQFVYIKGQVGVSRYNAIYGSFAALPLFLIFLEMSWLVVLFGAEISFANQNIEKYEKESESLSVNLHFKRILSLAIANLVIKNFQKGDKPLTATDIAHSLQIPIRLVREIIFELVGSNIFSEVISQEDNQARTYQPAVDIQKLSIYYVLEELNMRGVSDLDVADTKELVKISSALDKLNEILEKSPQNLLLKDI